MMRCPGNNCIFFFCELRIPAEARLPIVFEAGFSGMKREQSA